MTQVDSGQGFTPGLVEVDDPDLVIACDVAGCIVSVRGPLSKWLGWLPEDVLGRNIVPFTHLRNQEVSASMIAVMANKAHLELTQEMRVRAADGSWVWVDSTVYGEPEESDAALSVTVRPLPPDVGARLDRRHEPTDAIIESEHRFRSLANAAPIGVFHQLIDGTTWVNDRYSEITGLTPQEAAEGGWAKVLHPDDRPSDPLAYEAAQRWGTKVEHRRLRIRRPDGELRWIEVSWNPTTDDHGEPTGVVGTMEDVTERVQAVDQSVRLSHALEATPDLVAIWDALDESMYLNDAGRRFIGSVDIDDAAHLMSLLPESMNERWFDEVEPTLRRDGVWRGEIEIEDVGGDLVPMSAVYLPRWGDDGRLIGIAAMLRDITEFKDLQAQLDHQASHDPLTGLPNRVLLHDRLEVALGRSARNDSLLAVLFLDLDRFKVVNDSLGHSLGDRVLVALASRIEAVLRPSETVARFGGDEFVVLAEDLPDTDAAVALAERLTNVAAQPVDVGDRRFVVSVSVGVSVSRGDAGADPDELISDADAAMYRAKARGGSCHELFDPRNRAEALGRLDMEDGLRRALEVDELRLVYQPKVDLKSGRLTGVEALIRWEHPTRGMLGPDTFLPVAQEINLMGAVGAWVIDRAFGAIPQIDAVRPAGADPVLLGVNLSAEELADPGVVDMITAAAARYGIDPARIALELTEHTLVSEVGAVSDSVMRLSTLGYQIAIDDFGTGYSSLAYLRTFPVDLLKIDRTFINGLPDERTDLAIVTSVLTLSKALGLKVVAEGVENAKQLVALRNLGCDLAQGYYLALPQPLDELLELVTDDPKW